MCRTDLGQGLDPGAVQPGIVSTRSDQLCGRTILDDAAVFVAAQKLYDSIVAAEGPEGGITDADTMWKRLSDALYHNAYMRDDGVIAVVADHLVDAWGRKGGAQINP